VWRLRTFGFHLARLDVRQESTVHARAIAAALGDEHWEGRDPVEQAGILAGHSGEGEPLPQAGDEGNKRLDAVFQALGDARRRHGADKLSAYIKCIARCRACVLAALALARLVDHADLP